MQQPNKAIDRSIDKRLSIFPNPKHKIEVTNKTETQTNKMGTAKAVINAICILIMVATIIKSTDEPVI